MSRRFRLGHIALSFHAASAAIVQVLMEQAGYVVELRQAPHAEMFELFRVGEVDGVVSAWLPASHGAYLAPFEERVVKVTTLYEPYCIWGVPDYVPVESLRSVEDLCRPDIAERMTKLIQGINPGAGISRFSQQMIVEYGLAPLGYHFEPGTEAQCFGRFEEAVGRKEWAIVPLWHPQWLHHTYRIRALAEPKGLLGGTDQATLVISQTAAGQMPDHLLAKLANLKPGNAVITALDHAICREGLSPQAAASLWLGQNAGQHEAHSR